MATFPAAVISFTDPTSTSKLNSPSHSDQHIDVNGEVEAIETELGVDPAGDYSTVVTRLDNDDKWGQVLTWTVVNAAGTGLTMWWRAPFACDISGHVIYAVSSGTGRTVAVAHTSAGDNALATATAGVTGTIGVVVALAASAVPSATAGEIMRITTTTCATAQAYGVTIVLAKTDTT